MTEREYRQAEGISRSQLWKLKETPEKFKWAMEHPEPATPALIFGAAAHKAMLEPKGFWDEYAVAPVVDRRTKAGKDIWNAFLNDLPEGKEIVSADDYAMITGMVEAANKNPFVEKLLSGEKEQPYFWKDDITGEICKVRLDCLTELGGKAVIVDYKTTMDASTDGFMHAAVKHGYDFQAAMYLEGLKKATGKDAVFVFIAQEKVEPYAVNILQADEIFVRRGYDIFREFLGTYHDCKVTGNWWGYLGPYSVVNNLALPSYLAKEVE